MLLSDRNTFSSYGYIHLTHIMYWLWCQICSYVVTHGTSPPFFRSLSMSSLICLSHLL